jgi:hypothetical protein
VELCFPTLESAIRYAERQGLVYFLQGDPRPAEVLVEQDRGAQAKRVFAGMAPRRPQPTSPRQNQADRKSVHLRAALDDPEASYADPWEVVAHPTLTIDEKRALLRNWAWHEYLIDLATVEGMPENKRPTRLEEVEQALLVLEAGLVALDAVRTNRMSQPDVQTAACVEEASWTRWSSSTLNALCRTIPHWQRRLPRGHGRPLEAPTHACPRKPRPKSNSPCARSPATPFDRRRSNPFSGRAKLLDGAATTPIGLARRGSAVAGVICPQPHKPSRRGPIADVQHGGSSMLKNIISESNRSVLDAVNILAGVVLAVSPWFLSYVDDTAVAAWNACIAGAVIALAGLGAVVAVNQYAEWANLVQYAEWANLVVGLWVIVSPWLLGFSAVTGAVLAHVIIGIVVVVLAAGSMWFINNRPLSAA